MQGSPQKVTSRGHLNHLGLGQLEVMLTPVELVGMRPPCHMVKL
jgi:hypothetical protein